MMPAYFLSMLAGPINMTLIVVGWQKSQFAWEVSRLCAMAALWIGGAHLDWSIEIMVIGHAAVLTTFSIIMLCLAGWAIKTADQGYTSLRSAGSEDISV
jgi:nitrate reductase gamma subunit